MRTAAEILWFGAGRPEVADVVDCPASADCWWCGHSCDGHARPLSSLPPTFPAPQRAALPLSQWLCRACGWSMCETVSLPASVSQARLELKARAGRRATVAISGEPASKRLILQLNNGEIGIWESPSGVSSFEGSTPDTETLRRVPQDATAISKGRLGDRPFVCEFLGAYPLDALSDGASGGSGTEKFRTYHHLGTCSRWLPCTDGDKTIIRQWVLNPPDEPWACMIFDGKKHGVVFAQPSQAASEGIQSIFFQGDQVEYDPATLRRQVAGIETLMLAGAGEDDITSGRYSMAQGGVDLLLLIREHEPALRPLRGTAGMDLAMYLRRSRKELSDGDDGKD